MEAQEFWNVENQYTSIVSDKRINDAKNGKVTIELVTKDKTINEKTLEEFKNDKALVLCGAGGRQGPLLSAFGIDTTIMDFSALMIKNDIFLKEKHNLNFKTIVEDANKDIFEENTFNLVIQPVSFNYIEKPANVFKNVNKWLKPGGTYIFGFANPWNYIMDDDWKTCINKIPSSTKHDWENGVSVVEHSHTFETMIKDALDAGFVMEEFSETEIDDSFKYAKNYMIVKLKNIKQ